MKKFAILLLSLAMVSLPLDAAFSKTKPVQFKALSKAEIANLMGTKGARGGSKLQIPARFKKSGSRGGQPSDEQIVEAVNKVAERLAKQGIDIRQAGWQGKLRTRNEQALNKANRGWLSIKGKKVQGKTAKSKTGFRFFNKGSRGAADKRFKVDSNHKVAASGARGGKKKSYTWEKSLDSNKYSFGNKKYLRLENDAGIKLTAAEKSIAFEVTADSKAIIAKKSQSLFDTDIRVAANDKKVSSSFKMKFGKKAPWKPAALNQSKDAQFKKSGKPTKSMNWDRKGKIDLFVIDIDYKLDFSANASVDYNLHLSPTLVAASLKPVVKVQAAASGRGECWLGACWAELSGSATLVDTYFDVAAEAELGGDQGGLYVMTQAHARYKLKLLVGNLKATWDAWFADKDSMAFGSNKGALDWTGDLFALSQKKTYLIGEAPSSSSGATKPKLVKRPLPGAVKASAKPAKGVGVSRAVRNVKPKKGKKSKKSKRKAKRASRAEVKACAKKCNKLPFAKRRACKSACKNK